MKFIIKFFISLFVFIFVFVVGSTIVVQVINNKFGVDILSTAFAIPKLVKEVDEETYITVPFEAYEHKELAEQINAQVGDFIVYDETNGYSFVPENVKGTLTEDLKIKDTVFASFIQTFLAKQEDNTLELKELSFNCETEMYCKMNVIVKSPLGITEDIPFLPKALYLNLSFDVTKGENISYTITETNFRLNTLSKKQTDAIVTSLNAFIPSMGLDLDTVANQIAESFMQIMIGNEENKGLVTSLMNFGASGYKFSKEETDNYLLVTVA